MPDLLEELRSADPLRVTALPASPALTELREAITATPRPVPAAHPARRIGFALAAVATITAVALAWAGIARNTNLPAVPATSPSASEIHDGRGTWVKTAAFPLQPRQDSYTLWANGSYYVIGGTWSSSCLSMPAADCIGKPLTDGARYDPIADSWTRIADAPAGLFNLTTNPNSRWAVMDKVIYLTTSDGVLAYDITADRWHQLPKVPASVMISQLVAIDGSIVAVGQVETGSTATPTYLRYEDRYQQWVLYDASDLPGQIEGIASIDGYLVLAGHSTAHPDRTWVARMRSFAGKVDILDDAPALDQRLTPVTVAGQAVWPRDDDRAHLYAPKANTWTSVSQPVEPGPLRITMQTDDGSAIERIAFVTTASMIALNGYLYEPANQRWAPTPDLPVPATDPLLAGGGDSILSCFGFDGENYRPDCYLLRPSAATLTTPGG